LDVFRELIVITPTTFRLSVPEGTITGRFHRGLTRRGSFVTAQSKITSATTTLAGAYFEPSPQWRTDLGLVRDSRR